MISLIKTTVVLVMLSVCVGQVFATLQTSQPQVKVEIHRAESKPGKDLIEVAELYQMNFSIRRVTVSYRLHPSVEIHAAIYCSRHRRLPQRSTVRRASESLSKSRAAGGAWFIPSLLRSELVTPTE